MPNITMNKVYVSGPPKLVTDLIYSIETRDPNIPKEQRMVFDFQSIIPMPKPLRNVETGHNIDCTGKRCDHWRVAKGKTVAIPRSTLKRWKKRYGTTNWWDWSSDNWGTKWNAMVPEIAARNPDLVVYEFNTAWAAPWPIYSRLCEAYPELNITWEAAFEEDGYKTWHVFPKKEQEMEEYQGSFEKEKEAYNEFKAKLNRGDINLEKE